jgi:hypothetical protein
MQAAALVARLNTKLREPSSRYATNAVPVGRSTRRMRVMSTPSRSSRATIASPNASRPTQPA